MKTIIKSAILLSFFILSTVSAQAQLSYGVQANVAYNTSAVASDNDDSFETDGKLGYGVGVFADIPLASSFSLRPSLNYRQKGGKMEQDVTMEGVTGNVKGELKLEYIEVPVVLVYNMGKATTKWYVGAGPSFGYGISGKAEISETFEGATETSFYKPFKDVEDGGLGFEQFDFSLHAIVGIHIFEKGFVQVEAAHGFTNIATDEFGADTFKNKSLMLTLGYRFK